MTVDQTELLLASSYRGEIRRDAFFDQLSQAFDAEGHGQEVKLLADLERAMARALRALLEQRGVDPGDEAKSQSQGRETAERLAGGSWRAFLEQFSQTTSEALKKDRLLRSGAMPAEVPTRDLLIAHE